MFRTRRIARAIGFAALSGLHAATAIASQTCAPEAGPSHSILRVLDGETVLLDDGREVRLVGALAPKADVLGADSEDWPPAREAVRTLQSLVGGRTVTLRYEGRRRDRYGRELAQLYVSGPDGTIWVQQHLIRTGQARAYTLPGNSRCLRELMMAELDARSAQRGLWSRDLFRIRTANEVDALLRLTGRFAIVEGRIAEITHAQRVTYINFGTDWRRDFTVSITKADRNADDTTRLDELTGKQVRVRGWIERRNGPMIMLSSPDAIEVLDAVGHAHPEAKTTTPR